MNLLPVIVALVLAVGGVHAAPPEAGVRVEVVGHDGPDDTVVTLRLTNTRREPVTVLLYAETRSLQEDWSLWDFRVGDGRLMKEPSHYRLAPGERRDVVFDVAAAQFPPLPPPVPEALALQPPPPLTARREFRFRCGVYDDPVTRRLGGHVSDSVLLYVPQIAERWQM